MACFDYDQLPGAFFVHLASLDGDGRDRKWMDQSPQPSYTVGIECCVHTDQRKPIAKSVSDDHPVERIAVLLVGERQRLVIDAIVSRYRQHGQPVTVHGR